ncbi:MAG: hypothetical protein N3G18_00780 [Candidatus Saccharicenans sp.]|nr:hypothetical protein [Candidatus Saccharicenans sp.]
MISTSLAINIVTALLAINVIWLIYILFRGHTESLVRTIIFIVLLGIILGYLQNTRLTVLSFKAIKNDLFPPDIPEYYYTVTESDTLYSHRTIYTFITGDQLEQTSNVPAPPELKLVMDPNGRTFTIEDPESVNLVLDQLKLPRVSHGVKELVTITGNQTDVGVYRWDDYPQGTLIVERALFQQKNTMKSYNAISRIIVDSRKY